MGKPHRLVADAYRGRVSVFVTCATADRHHAFADAAACTQVLQTLQREIAGQIELTSYCLMPDHGHLLLTGLDEGSDLRRAVRRWKQVTAHEYAQRIRRPLWQGNYWDWVLRDADDALAVSRYIVSDPLRSGLTNDLLAYPWWGSDRWTREALASQVWDARAPRWWNEWR
jgi:REP element-mobilizing transposase RayT